ncbi:hypothetical protein [Mucilaginibacter antarcticus]|uniref:DoxX family protein n=1 Tax=Mucilaginibacter antarcticus TaxID=1855725 RepID=A0ABW5XHT1_9SPHI
MNVSSVNPTWSLWKKILFRFVFLYLALQISPWTWLDITGQFVNKYYSQLLGWLVTLSNTYLYHVRPVLVPLNGSGDTSFGWAQLLFYLTVAALGCLIWSLADRKRPNYIQLNYWLCLFARYYLITYLFIYGVIKIFALQMVFPSLHALATPLGDFLPMRFSWYFIGYSTPYQVFSGFMEMLAALLLLNWRTATLGVLLATAVLTNVMALNLCFDIPVKIFSAQLVFTCLVLLVNESRRIINFFVLNKPADTGSIYEFTYNKKWKRVTRIIVKVCFIAFALAPRVYQSAKQYKAYNAPKPNLLVKNGVYEPVSVIVNNKPVQLLLTDSLLWQDLILEDGTGSIKTGEKLFKRRYNRVYFVYEIDSANHTFVFKENVDAASVKTITLNYSLPDTNTIKLWGKKNTDSVAMIFKRKNRHFQLAERQFHWLTEYNR